MTATIDELTVADGRAPGRRCGFAVEGDTCVVGDVRIRLAGPDAGKGLTGWSLREVETTELDGLTTALSDRPPPGERAGASERHHRARPRRRDHARRSSGPSRCCRAPGSTCAGSARSRRPPGAPRQAFFRLGADILEVVQEPAEAIERAGGDRPAFFWGLAFVAPDLDATVAGLGDRVSEVRAAVQPGRRIATLRRSAGLAVPIALITPPVN